MVDLRDVTQLAKLPIEMVEVGEAINKAISGGLKVRIRVSNNDGLYVDTYPVITGCFFDESGKKVSIYGSEFNLEFSFITFEINSMSNDKHTKIYFRQGELTIGITVMY